MDQYNIVTFIGYADTAGNWVVIYNYYPMVEVSFVVYEKLLCYNYLHEILQDVLDAES